LRLLSHLISSPNDFGGGRLSRGFGDADPSDSGPILYLPLKRTALVNATHYHAPNNRRLTITFQGDFSSKHNYPLSFSSVGDLMLFLGGFELK
jgi:hypothetical protein